MGGWGTARGNTIIFFKIEVLMSGPESLENSPQYHLLHIGIYKKFMTQY